LNSDFSKIKPNNSFFTNKSNLQKLHLFLNKFYPLFWVLTFQVVAVILIENTWLQLELLRLYQKTLWFSAINKTPPFSTPFGQAYAMALVLLMPIQLMSLLKLGENDISAIVIRNFEKGNLMPPVFFGGCFLVLFFFLPLGNIALVRLLGGGWLAVSIITPIITSLLPISIRLFKTNLSEINFKKTEV